MALLEIRWHGRGGQGAKTAALLIGDAAVETGKYSSVSRIRTRKNGRTGFCIQSYC